MLFSVVTYNFFFAARFPVAPQALGHHALLDVHEGNVPLVQARQELPIGAEFNLPSTAETHTGTGRGWRGQEQTSAKEDAHEREQHKGFVNLVEVPRGV